MLRLLLLGAAALASNSEGTVQPTAPEKLPCITSTFPRGPEDHDCVISKTKRELAINFKLTKAFEKYDQENGVPIRPEIMSEIITIFLLEIDMKWLLGAYDDDDHLGYDHLNYDFVNEPRDDGKWNEMMEEYTDMTDLHLQKFYKKAVSPEIINFFAKYCGTRWLWLPAIDGDLFADFGDVEIPEIEFLYFEGSYYKEFPSAVFNFTGLVKLDIRFLTKASHICPDIGERTVILPKLKDLDIAGYSIEKISKKFLSLLPQNAVVGLRDSNTSTIREICHVSSFLDSGRWYGHYLCDGSCQESTQESVPQEPVKEVGDCCAYQSSFKLFCYQSSIAGGESLPKYPRSCEKHTDYYHNNSKYVKLTWSRWKWYVPRCLWEGKCSDICRH